MTRDVEALKDKLKSIIDVIDYDDLLLMEYLLSDIELPEPGSDKHIVPPHFISNIFCR